MNIPEAEKYASTIRQSPNSQKSSKLEEIHSVRSNTCISSVLQFSLIQFNMRCRRSGLPQHNRTKSILLDSKLSFTLYRIHRFKVKFFVVFIREARGLETVFFNKRTNYSLSIVSQSQATRSSPLAIANDDMFSRYFRGGIFSKNWREVAVAMLLNMLRRVKRDAGLASALTRMCRPRRHLPFWCLRSLLSFFPHCPRELCTLCYSTQILVRKFLRRYKICFTYASH